MHNHHDYDHLNQRIGARLRHWRQKRSMTQAMLARHLEVTPQQVQKYETGASGMMPEIIAKACRALDTSPNVLFGASGLPVKVTPDLVEMATTFVNDLDDDMRQATIDWWQAFARHQRRKRK